jgi:hypothetical protein
MQRKKQIGAVVALSAVPIGGALGRLHVIGPNPGTFFALGVLATLSVIGIAYGVWDAVRSARLGRAGL